MERLLMYKIYSTKLCGYCVMAKQALKNRDIEYEDIDVHETPEAAVYLRSNNLKTVPQIYDSEGNHIGGYTDLIQSWKD